MSETQGKLVAEFEKNSSETVRLFLQTWRQGQYCDIRVWTALRPGDEAGEQPTHKGITLRVDLLPELRKAIDKVIAEFEFGEGEKGPEQRK
jgi:hypothetical protein